MKVCGITFFVHWSFAASMIFLLGFALTSTAGWGYLFLFLPDLLRWVLSVMIVLLVHEAGHAMTSVLLGKRVRSVGLIAFGAVTLIEDLEYASDEQQLLVIAAGPISSLAFAGAAFALWQGSEIASISMSASIGFFNAVPIYPLDGGRIMHIASRRLQQKTVRLTTGSVSLVACVVVMVLMLQREDIVSAVLVFIVHIIGLTVLIKEAST